MSAWELAKNPAYAGKAPAPLKPDCHDRSHFITIRCQCGFDNHVHESSIVEVPPDSGIRSACKGCGALLEFPPGFMHDAFAELRRQGWAV
jgi:hypothetical protein